MATRPSSSFDFLSQATAADELNLIVQRAQAVTRASGAAAAVGDVQAGEVLCLASSGPNAPNVGSAVRVEGTLTGLCIQSGRDLLCDDAETDARVDAAATGSLGIRSILVTPVREQTRVLGVLAVFSTMPHAFADSHLTTLKTLAEQISTVLRHERRVEGGRSEVLSLAPSSIWETTNPEAPPSSTATLQMPAPNKVAENIVPVPVPALAPFDPQPARPATLECELAQPESGPIEASKGKIEAGVVKLLQAAVAKNGRNKWILLGATAAVLALAVAIVLLLHRTDRVPSTYVSASRPEIQESAPLPSGDIAAQAQSSNPSAGAKPEPVENRGSEFRGRNIEQGQRDRQPGGAADLHTILVPSSKIAGKSLISERESQDVAANPGVGTGSELNLNLLARPTNTLPLGHSDLVPATLIHSVAPSYPQIARTYRIGGAVILSVVVGKDGKVRAPKFVKGPLLLRDAAFAAVKQWTFHPASLDGQAIEQEMQVTVEFKPWD